MECLKFDCRGLQIAERSNCMASVAFVLSTQDFYLMVQLVKECAGIGIICAPYELQSMSTLCGKDQTPRM